MTHETTNRFVLLKQLNDGQTYDMRLRTITESDKIPGGLAKGMPDSAFDQTQLRNGIKVELEHTTDQEIAKEIAKDHLKEDPKYYIKLRKMENS